MLAPVVIFVFNRPRHTEQTFLSLSKNTLARDTDVIVFSDGPRHEMQVSEVDEVRKIIRRGWGFKSIRVIERERNLGLAENIISGVSAVLVESETVIVLEDDLVTSRFFLDFMNAALMRYRDEQQVACINGYTYPLDPPMQHNFFLRGADCWGWATWRRGWNLFDRDGAKLLQKIRNEKLEKLFDLDGSYKYSNMLKDQVAGRNNSWAIRWHAALFLENCLTFYPHSSLVSNIGFDASGVHCAVGTQFDVKLYDSKVSMEEIKIVETQSARTKLVDFFRKSQKTSKDWIPAPVRVLRRKIIKWIS